MVNAGEREGSMDRFNQLPEEKKLRIINAALSEFGSKGYRAASTNEIAKKASISKGSLFHYFGSKEQLYHWLLSYGTGILEQAFAESLSFSDGDLIESLTRTAVVKLKVWGTYPGLKDFLQKTCQERNPAEHFLDELARGCVVRPIDHASEKVDDLPFRSDLTLGESIQTASWILDGMTRDYLEAGLPLDETSTEKLTQRMLTILKKLLYKEE